MTTMLMQFSVQMVERRRSRWSECVFILKLKIYRHTLQQIILKYPPPHMLYLEQKMKFFGAVCKKFKKFSVQAKYIDDSPSNRFSSTVQLNTMWIDNSKNENITQIVFVFCKVCYIISRISAINESSSLNIWVKKVDKFRGVGTLFLETV